MLTFAPVLRSIICFVFLNGFLLKTPTGMWTASTTIDSLIDQMTPALLKQFQQVLTTSDQPKIPSFIDLFRCKIDTAEAAKKLTQHQMTLQRNQKNQKKRKRRLGDSCG